MTILFLTLAGVVAGLLTTVAGLGGGVLLVAGLSLFWPPVTVLAVTAPALMIGNLTRMWTLSRAIDWRTVGIFCLTAVPTALVGSLLATQMPEKALKLLIGAFLLAFVIQEVKGKTPAKPVKRAPWLPLAGGATSGFLSAVTGGGGFVSTPFLLRYGLEKAALVATSAACMAAVHVTKVVGFGAVQMVTTATVGSSLWLALGITCGNHVGARLLDKMDAALFRNMLLAGLVLAAGLMFS